MWPIIVAMIQQKRAENARKREEMRRQATSGAGSFRPETPSQQQQTPVKITTSVGQGEEEEKETPNIQQNIVGAVAGRDSGVGRAAQIYQMFATPKWGGTRQQKMPTSQEEKIPTQTNNSSVMNF